MYTMFAKVLLSIFCLGMVVCQGYTTTDQTTATSRWIANAQTDGVANTFPLGEESLHPNMIPRLEDYIGMMKKYGINMLGVGYPLLLNAEFSNKPVNGRYFKAIQKKRIDHLRSILRAALKSDIANGTIIIKTKADDFVKHYDYSEHRNKMFIREHNNFIAMIKSAATKQWQNVHPFT